MRRRLVRQGAFSSGSSTEISMASPPKPLRKRHASQEPKTLRRQLSSDSLDHLLSASKGEDPPPGRSTRRHSVACGVLYVDVQRPSIKAALSHAVRRVSDACSLLSSVPSSSYNLSAPVPKKREEKILLPQVLGTFRQSRPKPGSSAVREGFAVNRRFSTDCPPPSYNEAVSDWKQTVAGRQKVLARQQKVVATTPGNSLAEDDNHLTDQE